MLNALQVHIVHRLEPVLNDGTVDVTDGCLV
jgi:hypothetical protein